MFARIGRSGSGNLLLELAMIVVGISIALGLEGWAQDREEARTEQMYLRGLQDDLETDLVNLQVLRTENRKKLEELQSLIPSLPDLPEASQEVQASTLFAPATYYFFEPSDFTYVALQESGDFHLLEDLELQRGLLRLVRLYRTIDTLQTNYIQGMDDVYIPLMMASFDMATLTLTDRSIADNQMFRNSFIFAAQETEQRLQMLDKAHGNVQRLITLITAQRSGA